MLTPVVYEHIYSPAKELRRLLDLLIDILRISEITSCGAQLMRRVAFEMDFCCVF